MAVIEDIIRRYAEQAGMPSARFLRNLHSNVYVGSRYGHAVPADERVIYSYGSHFPMASIMPRDGNRRGWWLVNGDKYSVSTTRHQNMLRDALKLTGLDMMIVPFSALRNAGIDSGSVSPLEIRPDYDEMITTSYSNPRPDSFMRHLNARQENGIWVRDQRIHHLGSSLFTAQYRQAAKPGIQEAFFLSAFDENEPGFGLYFLAQLPPHAHPATVAEAFQALKPGEVITAESESVAVLRQGDVFAIPRSFRTRDLPGPSSRHARVLGVSHAASEVRVAEGHTYARGVLRHRPLEAWRRAEHRPLTLGDGKTWYELVRNTVPDGRSWSARGNVD